jgi:Mlc titration factor MtfA (ptsG expression regulator)
MVPIIIFSIGATFLIIWIGSGVIRSNRRKRLMHMPFPDEWKTILKNNLPPYAKLNDTLKTQLHGYIHIFLAEKNFEGCGGLELTDEIRVTVAAQACMLLLNRKVSFYPKLTSILIYPSTYVAGNKGIFGNQHDGESVRLGESWTSGLVVLSWDSVKRGAKNFEDGHNVTFHEFAHQLDQEDGYADGAPILQSFSCYASWARILTSEYKELKKKKQKHKKSVMDKYGATNAAEFFAVATETFFEKPRQLRKKHPELFDELKDYYKLDPLEWE